MNDIVKVTHEKELVFGSFTLRKTGLEVVGQPTFEEWLECGSLIRQAGKSVHFWIGDWLNYGERRWGEKYREAVEKTGYDYQTLRHDKWIAARVPEQLRRENLSFDHHATVADLETEEQEELLTAAVEKKMNNEEFRKFVHQQYFPKGSQIVPSSAQLGSVDRILEANKRLHQLLLLLVNDHRMLVKSYAPAVRQKLVSELSKTASVINDLIEAIQAVEGEE